MLKKLAKYGNSTALVIDKAILELLNIDDTTLVKLHTDGKSLIITPVKANQTTEKVSYGGNEALMMALGTINKAAQASPTPLNNEAFAKVQKECKDVFLKYGDAFRKFSEISISPEFQNELSKITEKYDPVTQSVEYIAECTKLKNQFCPGLAEMDQELAAIAKKYPVEK